MEKESLGGPGDAVPKIRAIVIDDDVDVRDLFVELLKMNGVEVVATGSNGKDAADLYMTHNPNFVFIDYIMPEYDGLYGAKKIREFDPTAKIVLVSGSYFEDGKLDGLVNAILKKPIEIGEVVSTITKMICAMSVN